MLDLLACGISKFPLDAWFTQSVADLGFPVPGLFAWMAAMSEVAGGVLLAIGLCTRFAGFFLAFTLGVAAFMVHEVPLSSVFAWQHITILYFWAYVFFTFAGAGRLSLDGLLRSRGLTAATLGGTVVAVLAIACGMRTAPEPTDTPVVDIASVESVVLAGSFNDWSLEETPMEETEPRVWTATVEVGGPTPVEFKFVGDADWNLSAGESDQPAERFPVSGTADVGGAAANIQAYLPAAGAYEFRLSLEGLSYSVSALPSDEPDDQPAP